MVVQYSVTQQSTSSPSGPPYPCRTFLPESPLSSIGLSSSTKLKGKAASTSAINAALTRTSSP